MNLTNNQIKLELFANALVVFCKICIIQRILQGTNMISPKESTF